MKNLVCILALIIISLFAITSVKAVCPIYKTSIVWQIGTSIHGYSTTELPCQSIYYSTPTVESVFVENATLLNSGYTQGNPAELNFVYNYPDNGKTYSIFSDHYLITSYLVEVPYWNGGWYWYDPWRFGFIGIENGGYEGPDYWGYWTSVYYWVTEYIDLGSTSDSVVYTGQSPPFNPVSGCSNSQTSLGGIIASEPTAGVIGNRIVAFARGTDNALYYQHSAGGAFSGWLSLAGGTYQAPKSTVINGTLYLEVVGTDNNNYYKTTTDGINFSNWIQGTGDAETTPLVDFNGYNYDFRRGDSSASQPALCVQQSPIPPAEIVSVEFDRFEQPDRLLDNNPGNGKPNTDVGLRIFPDKTTPTDNTNRAKVKVKATLASSMPGVPIYFRVYDIDDPSDNAAPIDTTGSLGADNRGKVGTSSAGKLNVTSAPTNSFGVAEVELEVTKQPGDNFAVVASKSSTFLNGASINEQNIQVSGQTIPISGTTYSTNPSNPAIRTQTLTVWRKLHIEVDSMGNVGTDNNITGTITAINQFACPPPASPTIPCNIGYQVTTSATMDVGRFQNGRIVIGTNTYIFQVLANNANTILLNGMPAGSDTVPLNSDFRIYDDDDMDDEDIGNLNGDNGDDVAEPDTSLLQFSNSPTNNLLAPAYVVSVYDLSNSHENIPVTLNLPMSVDVTQGPAIPSEVQAAFKFDNSAYSNVSDFWAIYLSGAYQIDARWDGDGDNLNVLGITDSVTGSGQGCLLFLESTRPTEGGSTWGIGPRNRAYTVAHEVGHKFGGLHGDGDLMAPTSTRTVGTFSNTTLNRIRNISNP